MSLVCKERIV